ncbi:VanZ family protein [Parasphaerochaeta coccoides]|uniref:VanZ family protein n=1 Tax=Parasphaerochaeta coccoides (strain ATCC BAA-1237 / DSM 17374 / SPN1) TaxID=760011 RepID=F4GI50_PARC1|nr:VanZ family protein [Parasphaerochaeta coccoides]AEC02648.1 VanZ family protein [Parasphaerochaeta coccoides DSM 17374]
MSDRETLPDLKERVPKKRVSNKRKPRKRTPEKREMGLIRHVGLLLSVVIALGIAVLSLLPARVVSIPLSLFPHADKVSHMVAYALLAAFSNCAVFSSGNFAVGRRRRWLVLAVTAAYGLYGLGIEVLQFFSGRSFSLFDAAANFVGAFIGAATSCGIISCLWASGQRRSGRDRDDADEDDVEGERK